MSRSIWKGPSIFPTISRSSSILPSHIGSTFIIHNGKSLKSFLVLKQHVGFKFGDFFFTTKPAIFKKK